MPQDFPFGRETGSLRSYWQSDAIARAHAAVRTRRSLERGAAEADLVAVGVAIDHLAHAVPVPLLRGGLDSPGADALDPLIEVAGEHRVQCMAGALGQLLDVEVSVPGKLPHRLRRVREERGSGAQQPLVPRECALVVAHRKPREEAGRHACPSCPWASCSVIGVRTKPGCMHSTRTAV